MTKTPTAAKTTEAPKPAAKAPEPKAAEKAPEPAPEPIEETCSVCGAVTINVVGGVCLACRS
jgi:hypothetical protein